MKRFIPVFFFLGFYLTNPATSIAIQQKSIQNPDDKLNRAKELFEQRLDQAKLEEAIKILEEILASSKDYESAVLLSRSYYFLAEFTDEKDAKLEVYNKGLKAGEIALNTIEIYKATMVETKKEEAAIKALNKDNMEAIYWAAANLARWSKFAPFTKKVAAKARVRYLWDKVYEIDPSYFYGGAYRFYGGYYALVPTITGEQDTNKSKEMFEKCLQVAPQYLETKVLYAEAYCTHAAIKDRDLFKKLLNEVIGYDLSASPEILPENTIAKEKAKKLLYEEPLLFE